MVVKQLLIALAICSLSFAADARIDGPSESQAGDLVVLNSVAAEGDKKQWIIPTSLENRFIQTEHQIAFAVRESGDYRFGLVAVSLDDAGEIAIDVATHTVKITGGLCDPVPPTDPGPIDPGPVDPDPDPPAPPTAVYSVSRAAAESLDDPPTAKALANVLSAIQEDTIERMKQTTRDGVESVLLARTGESRNKDWLNVWRRPVDSAITSRTPPGRKQELTLIAKGLSDSMVFRSPIEERPIDESPVVRIEMGSRPDCPWCDKWKREEWPSIHRDGWVLSEVRESGSVPTFRLTVNGQTRSFVGFKDAKFLRRHAEEMSQE